MFPYNRIILKSKLLLKKEDVTCDSCFKQLWNELLYNYRISINDSLPREVGERPNCWYGDECRTQVHNIEHARRFNHICRKVALN